MKKGQIILLGMMLATMSACTTTGGVHSSTGHVERTTRNPKAAETNMRLGLSYLERGEYKIALHKLEKALRQDPNLASAHNTIAILYQRLGENKKAELHFKQAIRNQSDYSAAHNNYGVFLCEQKRYKEAEKEFLAAVKNPLYETPGQAYENAGLCLNRIPDQTLAEKYFRKALQINPKLPKSLLHMAQLRLLNIDYLDARAYMQRYQEVAPWTPQALLTAIKIEHHLHNTNTVESLKLLLRREFPDSDEAAMVVRGQY